MPQNNKRNPFVLAPALTLVVLALLLIFGLIRVRGEIGQYVLCGVLTLIAFGIPLFLYMLVRGVSPETLFPFHRMRSSERRIALVGLVALISADTLVRYGLLRQPLRYLNFSLYGFTLPYPDTFSEGLVALVCVVLIPAFFEEILLRGAIPYEYRFVGAMGAGCFGAVCAACLGLSFASFFPLFCYAVFFAAVRYLTGNLLASLLVHFGYGVWALFFEKYAALMATADESLFLFRLLLTAVAGLSFVGFFHCAASSFRERADADEQPCQSLSKPKRILAWIDALTAPSLWMLLCVFLVSALIRLLV